MPVSSSSALKYTSFTTPTLSTTPGAGGAYGGAAFPYYHGKSYFDSDLALFKTFHIFEKQTFKVEAEAFNWLNHPLPQFQGGYLSLNYGANCVPVQSPVDPSVTVCSDTGNSVRSSPYPGQDPANFGVANYKAGAPAQRIFELTAKYTF